VSDDDKVRDLETLADVESYSDEQIQHAAAVQYALEQFFPADPQQGIRGRGTFVYCIPPDQQHPS
jgi:hypothetical protein